MAEGDETSHEAQDDGRAFRTSLWQRVLFEERGTSYELTRWAVLRLLAFVYLVAFFSLARQVDSLLGDRGLLPVSAFLRAVHANLGGAAYWRVPTLFWLTGPAGPDGSYSPDAAMHVACWAGVALSALSLAGVTNAAVQVALWLLYASFVHVGQIFYGYGWELQLLETGFLAVFLCPWRSVRPFPTSRAPRIVFWLFRWLVFRVMVGAALIKLRGDSCWRDLTCLDFHFETQPNPNPVAYYMHHAPHGVHVAGVLVNHLVELVVPWFCFGPRRVRVIAGVLLVGFQILLITTGNLSFLNWLTIVPALACFDDAALSRLLPAQLRAAARAIAERCSAPARAQRYVSVALGLLVGVLSVAPVMNLVSAHQAMNESFDPLDLVNTYGAFGTVDRVRYEVILEGTADAAPGSGARWEEYELPCMPGDPRRRPCLVTPYHYRLDWQMWFVGNAAARGESVGDEPWLVHLVWQLLAGAAAPKRLLARDPFPGAPPRWIRADVWRYAFASDGGQGVWWERERVGRFLPPVSASDPGLRRYVSLYGWPDRP